MTFDFEKFADITASVLSIDSSRVFLTHGLAFARGLRACGVAFSEIVTLMYPLMGATTRAAQKIATRTALIMCHMTIMPPISTRGRPF